MYRKFTADELIENDSFINYCFHSNQDDFQEWQTYLLNNPDEINVVQEAKEFVLLTHRMLDEHSVEFSQFDTPEIIENISGIRSAEPEENVPLLKRVPGNIRIIRMRKYFYYAAASVVIAAGMFLLKPYFLSSKPTAALQARAAQILVYETAIAQKKTIWLPDSTRVVLNAKTTLYINKDFGKETRMVTLAGEAFFDVTHNQQKPFIVQTNGCRIKVLGTAFNVKAYPGETTSETSLLRGSIELTVKNDHDRKFLLRPSEKAVLYNKDIVINDDAIPSKSIPGKTEEITIKNITKGIDDGVIAETAWSQNRLEIVNEKFVSIQSTLERWFDVTIHFNDEKVKDYKFTATFKDENIQQVLMALKLSYAFNYTINGKDVYISSK